MLEKRHLVLSPLVIQIAAHQLPSVSELASAVFIGYAYGLWHPRRLLQRSLHGDAGD